MKKESKKKGAKAAKPKPTPEPVETAKPPEIPPDAAADSEQAESPPRPAGPPVAGIGASAGGLDAFKKFLTAMPPDSGIAIVLVPHLDPAHESLMVELLARHTTMPVVEAENGMPVEANRVYIIPPNKYMTIHDGVLRLTGPIERRSSQTSIDLFLRSLAEDQQERSICVILSGTGSHGALGLKAVKAAGGMAMVQDPTTAEYDRMPQSAISTGLADFVLPPEQMPEALIKYIKHAYVNGGARIEEIPQAADQLTQLLALLKTRSKFDFRAYRKKMLTRRIERRMSLNQLDSIPQYLKFLRENPEEIKLLVKDLFISVTSFFRDPEAFEHLVKEAIAPLVAGKESDAVIRVWAPGCATGEEPYSIAILLQEQLAAAHKNCRVQIFATDVDDDALVVARQGLYPESISTDVSPERLSRFFTKVDDHTYQVNKQIRETVTFAVQNLISDAPFTKLDLISCRNLLIYLEPDVQKKVVTLFHFALVEGGYLFLGSSETIGRQVDLFDTLSKKWRIYRRIGPPRPERVDFPIVAGVETEQKARRPAGAATAQPVNFAEVTQRLLLEDYAPAAVLINRKYEIFYYFGPCALYLELPTGQPTHDLTLMAREGLRTKLRGAVHRAMRDNQTVMLSGVQIKRNGGYYTVKATVRPVQTPKSAEGMLLITFQDEAKSVAPSAEQGEQARAEAADESTVRQLEFELKATREDLQSTIEEMESSNEELKASNEEIMSMNEELQSANEELETSKEELQSLNEELSTVNNQLQEKVDELEKANNDMANLLNCTDIATVFLDNTFRIKLFTPASTRLFNLIVSDIGRPIGDITARFNDPDLLGDAQEVLRQLAPREKEIATTGGEWWSRRISPYRTRDNRIDGVVITFVDITERKKATDAVVRRLAAVVESSADAIISNDLDGAIRTWNSGAERLYGYAAEEIIGRSTRMIIPDDRLEEWTKAMSRLARGEHIEQVETERLRKDGQRVPVELTYSPLRDHGGRVLGASVTARSLVERRRAEESLRQSEERFRLMANSAPAMIWMAGLDKGCTWFNKPWLDFVGRPMERELGNQWVENIHPDDSDRSFRTYSSAFDARRPFSMEYRLRRHDGEYRWLLDNGIPLRGAQEEFVGYIGSCIDITERKQAEQSLRASQDRLQAILNTAADAIVTVDYNGIIQTVNAATEQMFGYSATEMIGQNVKMLMPSPDKEAHDGYMARYRQTGEKHIIGISREVEAQRKDGSIFPTDLAVSEIKHLKLYTGIHRDLTERKQLERDVVEAASLEQRRIGQDLHDTVAQELTALNMVVRDLAEIVQSEPARATPLLERLNQGLQQSQEELRDVLRGLLPVAVDSEGLMSALADLADRTQKEGKVSCKFDCTEPVAVADNLTATHLYLIAQEAVHNAIKHARAQTVRIGLKRDGGLNLTIKDDGIGVLDKAATQLHEQGRGEHGMGLRIMRNRAEIIGAKLTIEPAKPKGTIIKCVLPPNNRRPK